MTNVDARRDFVAHNACWTLLAAARPNGILPSRLYQVLYSSQHLANTTGICLEHTFGGIFSIVDEYWAWPWEYNLADPLEFRNGPKDGTFSDHNPFSIPLP